MRTCAASRLDLSGEWIRSCFGHAGVGLESSAVPGVCMASTRLVSTAAVAEVRVSHRSVST